MISGESSTAARVAIIDYGLGNLFSVQQACLAVGLNAVITRDGAALAKCDALILPGVGAFSDAMTTLNRLDLVQPIRDAAAAGKPLVGICLGIQLLMSESHEFGWHQGLGLIPGKVVPLPSPREGGRLLKVPQAGWNRIRPLGGGPEWWAGTPLEGLADGEYMYFVHSFIAVPEDPSVVLSTTRYGDAEFCSSLAFGNIFACQFHPERSGRRGLTIYANLREQLHCEVSNSSSRQ